MSKITGSSVAKAGFFEAAVITALLLCAAAIWGFVEVADEVIAGDSLDIDNTLLRAFRQPGDPTQLIGPVWLGMVARDFTALGGVAVISLVTLATTGYLALRRKWGAMLLVIASIGGGAVVSAVLKQSFDRPRPSVVAHMVEVHSLSFPSGHSMLAAVTYLTLGSLLARTTADWRIKAYLLTLAMLLTVIIGVTRIFLGVHYPTDVLAGWCAGLSWALLCNLVARWLQRHGAMEAESPAKAD